MLPTDAPETVAWRLAQPDEIPGGATTVANRARKAGWTLLVGYARGPWVTAKDDETEEEAGIAEVITVQGRRRGARFRATWHRKLWTSDDSYKFAGATIDPAIRGEVAATKAKKDRSPEHLGAETLGGLKNSKTLNDYLKETS